MTKKIHILELFATWLGWGIGLILCGVLTGEWDLCMTSIIVCVGSTSVLWFRARKL